MKIKKDDVYKGELKRGKPHGKGTLISKTIFKGGMKYVGEFKNGEFDGQGTLIQKA